MGRFLHADYEQLLYHMYINCVQGNKSVTDHSELPLVSTANKAKYVPQNFGVSKPSNFPSRASNEGTSRTFNKGRSRNQPSRENLYAKPTGDICYRCNKIEHLSNVCHNWRQDSLLEVDENHEEEVGGDDDYAYAQFATKEGMDASLWCCSKFF